jgi:hypothetical protein
MWFNPIMEWLLKSPFHRLISGSTMIIYFIGRKSGKAYHTPIGYQRSGDTLFTVSSKDRTWWRNFKEGGDARLLLQGQLVNGDVHAFEDENSVIEGLRQFIGGNPRGARMFKVGIQADGQLDPVSLEKAAQDRVFIRTILK